MADRPRILLTHILEDLEDEDLQRFMGQLREPREDTFKPEKFRRYQLRDKNPLQLADLLVDSLADHALQVTVGLLRAIDCNDAANNLEIKIEEQSKSTTKPFLDDEDYYPFSHKPHGLCVVINNEEFVNLRRRTGSHEDERVLCETFTALGFIVEIHKNLDAAKMRDLLQKTGRRSFHTEDALVVCVLSNGTQGCVYGSDEVQVPLRDLTQPFSRVNAPSLAGKPKLFFIQACQGPENRGISLLNPEDEDFLLGMACAPEGISYRRISTGSFYIQELCKQLNASAQSPNMDDILTVLTRVTRNVSKEMLPAFTQKQVPQPVYTLTRKVVLRFV